VFLYGTVKVQPLVCASTGEGRKDPNQHHEIQEETDPSDEGKAPHFRSVGTLKEAHGRKSPE